MSVKTFPLAHLAVEIGKVAGGLTFALKTAGGEAQRASVLFAGFCDALTADELRAIADHVDAEAGGGGV